MEEKLNTIIALLQVLILTVVVASGVMTILLVLAMKTLSDRRARTEKEGR